MFGTAFVTGLTGISFLFASAVQAQVPITDARAASLGEGTVVIDGIVGMKGNPASLGSVRDATISFGHRSLYGLSELDSRSVTVVLPASWLTVGGGISMFGFEQFSTVEGCIALARRGERFGIGLSVRAGLDRFASYASEAGLSLDLGWDYRWNESMRMAAGIRNIGSARAGPGALQTSVGIAARHGNRFEALVAGTLSADTSPDLRFGVEYYAIGPAAVRLGGRTGPATLSAGAGISLEHVEISAAYTHHPVLGGDLVVTVNLVK